jgi:CHAT domain-containing protein/tetratricopeptide (TPR) repeat protein
VFNTIIKNITSQSFRVLVTVLVILSFFIDKNANASHFDSENEQNISIPGISIPSFNDSLKQLINLSEDYWSTNRNKSDSLIKEAFLLMSKKNKIDSLLLVDAYHILGKSLINKGDYIGGIDTLKRCNVLKHRYISNNYKSISKTVNYIGIGFLFLQNYDSAIYYCHQAKIPLLQNNISDINLYYAYLNIGIGYSRLGKYNSALDYFDTAFLVLNESGLINDNSITSGYYYNYALYTTLTGKLKEANEYFENAEKIYRKIYAPNHLIFAGINNNKGINSYYGYEFSKAELYYNKALEIYLSDTNTKGERIARTYNNLCNINHDRGDHISSLNYCLSGLQYSQNNDLRLILFKNAAISYAALGNIEKANDYFNTALDLLQQKNINPKRSQELYSSYADFLKTIAHNDLCIYYYNKALKSAKMLVGVKSDQYANILFNIGDYYLENKKLADSAINYFYKSIEIFDDNKSGLEGDNLNIIQKKKAEVGYASALLLKYYQTDNTDYLFGADSVFTGVLKKMEEISKKLNNANKLLLIELMNPVYVLAVECSFELYQKTHNIQFLEKVSNLIERSKSSALLAEVNSEFALKTSDIPQETFNYEHQLKEEINGLQQLLGNEKSKDRPDLKKINFFESKLLNHINKHDSLIDDIENRFPKYYSVKYKSDVIGLDKIKENLDDDEVILEYLLTDSILYIMAVTDSKFDVKEIHINEAFYNSLNYIISLKYVNLSEQNLIKFNEFKHHSHNLWKTLIEPHDMLISNKRLIIIPDGLLGYLPFDLLIEYDFETDRINYRDLPYLLKNHPLSYSYSATLKYNTYFDKSKKKAGNKILAFAPKYNNPDQNENGQSIKLYNLPFARSEVEQIIGNHGGKSFIDEFATKTNFKKFGNSYSILHLAMHTIINDSLPFQSKLVFYNDEIDTNSNFMFTHEIYNMDINASMVTLSACNTGSGRFSKGEGIMSLARGFVYAGVPSIVMTLWEVQDAIGSKIMDNYYKYLVGGYSKDIALQKAKLGALKDANMANAHPFFWSAYIINGDTTKIGFNKKPSNSYILAILGSIFIVIIILIILFRNKRKKS